MNDYDGILIESLSSYLNNKDIMSEFDSDTAKKLIARSKEQKVLPIIYLKNSSSFEKVLPAQEYHYSCRLGEITKENRTRRSRQLRQQQNS